MTPVKFTPIQKNAAFKVLEATPEMGAVMSPHRTDHDAALYVSYGKLEFKLGEEIHLLTPRSSISIPANQRHSFEVIEDACCILILPTQATIRFDK